MGITNRNLSENFQNNNMTNTSINQTNYNNNNNKAISQHRMGDR
jgi:hypothetical protein